MENTEQIVTLLSQIIKLMKNGKFTKTELEFIKAGLEKMLKATQNILDKI